MPPESPHPEPVERGEKPNTPIGGAAESVLTQHAPADVVDRGLTLLCHLSIVVGRTPLPVRLGTRRPDYLIRELEVWLRAVAPRQEEWLSALRKVQCEVGAADEDGTPVVRKLIDGLV